MTSSESQPQTDLTRESLAAALAHAFEWVRDPDDPKAVVIPTGRATMLSSEIPALRQRQAELVADFVFNSGVALPSPAPEPPPLLGYWEASGDLTPETAKTMRPILEQAARDGKQLVVHKGVTLRWVKAAPVEAEGLDVELLTEAIGQADWFKDSEARYISFGGYTIRRAAKAIAVEYLRLLEQREATPPRPFMEEK